MYESARDIYTIEQESLLSGIFANTEKLAENLVGVECSEILATVACKPLGVMTNEMVFEPGDCGINFDNTLTLEGIST